MDKIQALEIQDAMMPVVAGLKAKYNATSKLSIKYDDSEVRITITLKTAPQGTPKFTGKMRSGMATSWDLTLNGSALKTQNKRNLWAAIPTGANIQ